MRRLRGGHVSGEFDVAIVGSGFAGSLLAIAARRIGRSVVLVEKGSHPRFAIGESSSPLANLLLDELCGRFDLTRVRPLVAFGSWRRERPDLDCGLKRGFTFYGHCAGKPFERRPGRGNELLVAASPNDEVADTHWLRADFDAFLAAEARLEGVEYLDETDLDSFEATPAGARLEGLRRGRAVSLRARFVVDASGPRGFLQRALGLPGAAFADLPPASGLYTHFENVRRLEDLEEIASDERPPYPVDDAAVHHVFDGGWIWVLRFESGLVSAGISASARLASELDLASGAGAWDRLLARFPTIARQFEGANPVRPFTHAPRLSFRTSSAAGPRWMLLPSAAAFVDPLLSTGIPLALLGVGRVADALDRHWNARSFDGAIEAIGRQTLFEADTTARLIAALFASFGDFEVFAALTLPYFAAASYAEAARRLGKPRLAGAFLSGDHPSFGPALARLCRNVLDASADGTISGRRSSLLEAVMDVIEPLDVIGLSRRSRRHWHPFDEEPLIEARGKLGATRDEIEAMVRRAGGAIPANGVTIA
jgi:FADH2 O2-dependent halogenase